MQTKECVQKKRQDSHRALGKQARRESNKWELHTSFYYETSSQPRAISTRISWLQYYTLCSDDTYIRALAEIFIFQ